MIRLEKVSKTFYPPGGNSRNEGLAIPALKEINLTIHPGEYVMIIGANGSGKSTLLNAIAGTFRPDNGQIYVDGEEISRQPSYQRSRKMARLFQNPLTGTAQDLTILENFRLAALRASEKGLRNGIDSKFRTSVADSISTLGMGLENKLKQPMGSLSGGQRQALTLLMSTMAECKVLLMDEPCSALDPRSAGVIMKLADSIIREKRLTVVLVTHRLRDCIDYGDRVLVMEEGTIIRDISGNEKSGLTLEQLMHYF